MQLNEVIRRYRYRRTFQSKYRLFFFVCAKDDSSSKPISDAEVNESMDGWKSALIGGARKWCRRYEDHSRARQFDGRTSPTGGWSNHLLGWWFNNNIENRPHRQQRPCNDRVKPSNNNNNNNNNRKENPTEPRYNPFQPPEQVGIALVDGLGSLKPTWRPTNINSAGYSPSQQEAKVKKKLKKWTRRNTVQIR